ncbi:MAG: hypothetical protein ACHQ9S_08535 [Candidatus Binatia bacterium]
MPAGNWQRTWFPEMVEVLRTEWRAEMSWNDLIALRDRLDGMLQHIRTSRHIELANANMACPHCGAPVLQGSSNVSVRAAILALARFGVASEADVAALEKRWKKYRQATGCDLDGKPSAAGGPA